MLNVLVTGGAGYIGSHVCVALLEAGHQVTVVDNLCNSSARSMDAVQSVTGRTLNFTQMDIRDTTGLVSVMQARSVDVVIHLAGLKAVGESVQSPLAYYSNNVGGTLSLLHAMEATGARRLIFSSSATVYGVPDFLPYTETHPTRPSSPYGHSKLHAERMLRDLCHSSGDWSIVALRYFNPVGAHASAELGEDPRGTPNNLMPFIAQVAAGLRDRLTIFGDDYATRDGTCVRDYLHVMDLASGHLEALSYSATAAGFHAFNLGTGQGTSVRELLAAFEVTNRVRVPHEIGPRRAGDIDAFWADPALAVIHLGWKPRHDLADMCESTWRWQLAHPRGFQ